MPPSPSSRWALVRLARSTWRDIRESWRATPPAARRSYFVRIAAGFALATAASALSAWWLSGIATDGRLPGDARLEPLARGLMSIHSAVWLGALNSSLVLIPVLLLAAVLGARAGRWERAASMACLYAGCKAVIFTGWGVWERARPSDVVGGELVPAGLASYPSGHALQGVAFWGLFAWWWTRASRSAVERALAWVVLALTMVAVGVARVVIGAHHPTDVVGGLALGGLCLATAILAERAVGRP